MKKYVLSVLVLGLFWLTGCNQKNSKQEAVPETSFGEQFESIGEENVILSDPNRTGIAPYETPDIKNVNFE